MLNLILAAHIILMLLLVIWFFGFLKSSKTSITIHNLPVILLTGLGLCAAVWCAKFRLEFFIPTGVLLGFIVFAINSVKLPNYANPSIFRKICMSLLCMVFWPEMIVLLWVMSAHVRKINEKPQH